MNMHGLDPWHCIHLVLSTAGMVVNPSTGKQKLIFTIYQGQSSLGYMRPYLINNKSKSKNNNNSIVGYIKQFLRG